jgi:hypothetical protein
MIWPFLWWRWRPSVGEVRMRVVCRDPRIEARDVLLHRVHRFDQRVVLAERRKSEWAVWRICGHGCDECCCGPRRGRIGTCSLTEDAVGRDQGPWVCRRKCVGVHEEPHPRACARATMPRARCRPAVSHPGRCSQEGCSPRVWATKDRPRSCWASALARVSRSGLPSSASNRGVELG